MLENAEREPHPEDAESGCDAVERVEVIWNSRSVEMNDEVERIASSDDACRRLRQIPGIGPLVATAIVASIGNGRGLP